MKPEELAKFDGPDDATLQDPEPMWRRIHPNFIAGDDATKGSRISQGSFKQTKNPIGPCSLIRSSLSTPEQALKAPHYSLGAIMPSVIRREGFKLVHAPEPDEPGHYNMVGPNEKHPQREARTRIADTCTYVFGTPFGPGIPPPEKK